MKKMTFIFDSFSGQSKTQLAKMGFYFLPQIVYIDDKVIRDGEDGTLENYYKLILKGKEFKTSIPIIGEVEELFKKLSKKYDDVIYVPINKGLSSTFSSGSVIAKKYKNVHVVDVKFAGMAGIYAAKKYIKKYNGENIEKIKTWIKKASDQNICWIIPKNIDQLVKSGRIKGIKKIFLEKSHLIPHIFLSENGVIIKSIRRNFNKLIQSSIKKILISIKNSSNYQWELIWTKDTKTRDIAKNMLKEFGIKDFIISFAAVSTTIYNGIGSIGINAWKK